MPLQTKPLLAGAPLTCGSGLLSLPCRTWTHGLLAGHSRRSAQLTPSCPRGPGASLPGATQLRHPLLPRATPLAPLSSSLLVPSRPPPVRTTPSRSCFPPSPRPSSSASMTCTTTDTVSDTLLSEHAPNDSPEPENEPDVWPASVIPPSVEPAAVGGVVVEPIVNNVDANLENIQHAAHP
ncbi:hypothetical protein BU14_0234s0006 [Porphyra umbilicalis]|uniref:Uncharacterized protein n=1 Tax=Porphyra umbilicalis TaxID=2786 RepID=A0A1X6P3L6_PORUM|nr:hypothetical protein BU14_0234s0006 [Porphyra umbilicalis]|eukprot:OSX75479.1 hypothetical protein BU14_0234s0006 [Porphyra umbilicalis]